MKKLVLLGALVASVFFVKAQTAGKIFVGDSQGKPFKFGSEKSSNVVLEAVKAYNANNSAAETALWSDEMIKKYAEANQKGHAEYRSVVNKPMAILPLYAEGQKTEVVLLQSTEERIYKNGSKQNLNLFELFQVDKAGKISGFTQYYSIPKTNEYGKTYGGKYIAQKPGSEVDGRPLEFSNRGEVEAIEKLAKAWNAMDVKAFSEVIADEVTIEGFDGSTSKLTKAMIPATFAEFKSLDWKPGLILPFKLQNTDPVSGIIVYSSEKRVLKDGSVWDKDLIEVFRFNLAGKIDQITQFSKEKTKK
jgi:hypothetical protein